MAPARLHGDNGGLGFGLSASRARFGSLGEMEVARRGLGGSLVESQGEGALSCSRAIRKLRFGFLGSRFAVERKCDCKCGEFELNADANAGAQAGT